MTRPLLFLLLVSCAAAQPQQPQAPQQPRQPQPARQAHQPGPPQPPQPPQPGGPPRRDQFAWWDSPLASEIGLSDQQAQKIRAVVKEYRTQLIQLHAAVEIAEVGLHDLLDDEQVDSRKANEAIEKGIAARGELARALAQMSLKMRLVLTAKQWRDVQRRQQGGLPMPGATPLVSPGYRPQQPGGPPPARQE